MCLIKMILAYFCCLVTELQTSIMDILKTMHMVMYCEYPVFEK